MECNKEEAMRAKDIAERKFTEKEFAGAKKFALKAQSLYPGLDNISQMLRTIDVYLSAESRINGEMDMYAILGVSPMADDDTIKKQYKKLVLTLHPDKNKSVGADGAFQLVQEAYSFLCDKAKRSAYNIRRNIKIVQQKVQVPVPPQSGVSMGSTRQSPAQAQGGVSSMPPRPGKKVDQKVSQPQGQGGVFGASKTGGQSYQTQQGNNASQQSAASSTVNGHHKQPASSSSSRAKTQKSSTTKKASTSAAQSFFKKGDTFWTVCTRCKMQYEYMSVYVNQTLKCPHCQGAFVAIQVPPPSNVSPLRRPQQQQHHPNSSWGSGGPRTSLFNNNSTGGGASARWSPMSGTTTFVPGSSTTQDRGVKREREDPQETTRWDSKNNSAFVYGQESKRRREEKGATGFANREAGRHHSSSSPGISSKHYLHRELSPLDLRKILAEKALIEIQERLNQWKSSTEARAAARDKAKAKPNDRLKQKLTKSSHTVQDSETNVERKAVAQMSVPDPDFHVFDLDRLESCFEENQVWAAYDDDDGMPRFYALIHEVISLDPFEVKLSWLNSKSNSEFSSSMDWIGRGFIKTCGEFRVGKHVTNNSVNSFSHKVRWGKGPRGVIHIYPKKGEIWALYRNWSPAWDMDTPDEVKHAYEMVEVLDDYSEDSGVSVAPICKAPGFQTVFHKQPEPKEVKHITKGEMFRFSHQVPSHMLTGEEKPNAPKGYVELDPAATPPDLLQVNKDKRSEE